MRRWKRDALAAIVLAAGLGTGSADAANIMVITESPADDAAYAGALRHTLGHNVTVRHATSSDPATEMRTLDATKIAEMNAQNLVIVARLTNSGYYANDAVEISDWNGVTTPMLLHSPYLARGNRWDWVDSDGLTDASTTDTTPQQPSHAAFEHTESTTLWIGTAVSRLTSTDAGNGSALLTDAANPSHLMMAEWSAGTAFHGNTSQTPAGDRIYFGTANGSFHGMTGDGVQVAFNTVQYLLGESTVDVTPVLTNVRQSNYSNSYAEVHYGSLAEGAKTFVDRTTHNWRNIPTELLGADYVLTPNNAKSNASITFELTVAEDALLHIFVDERTLAVDAGELDWLTDGSIGITFADSGLTIDIDENGSPESLENTFRIFTSTEVVGPGTYTLLGQGAAGNGFNMYGIAATAAPIPEPTAASLLLLGVSAGGLMRRR